MAQIIRSISFDPDIMNRLEKLRGKKTKFRSVFINEILRKEFGHDGEKEMLKESACDEENIYMDEKDI